MTGAERQLFADVTHIKRTLERMQEVHEHELLRVTLTHASLSADGGKLTQDRKFEDPILQSQADRYWKLSRKLWSWE